MKLLLFAGSLRKASFNKKLVHNAGDILKKLDASIEIEYLDLNDFNLAVMNEDLEEKGIPQGAQDLAKKVHGANGLVISTPEYNGSISSPLKNAIDWISRNTPMPLKNKPVLLLAATPGALAGIRTLWHTRVPFEVLGSMVFPGMFGLAQAHAMLDEETGKLKDEKQLKMLTELLKNYTDFVKRLS